MPSDVHAVLDVGCGVGCNTRALAAKGYKVTALSPDAHHKKYFDDFPADQVSFYASKYEDFSSKRLFDLVLMSESQNYFDAGIGLEQSLRFLVPSGFLLICGVFRKRNSDDFSQIRNIEGEYLLKAQQYGFELMHHSECSADIATGQHGEK
jgi:MPBQ/MSBQ methyltransferase